MDDDGRQRSRRAVLLVAVLYCAAGVAFGALAGWAGPGPIRTVWRLAAWAVSLAVFVAHIRYEHFRRRSGAITTALNVSIAVALGAFGLALAANVRAWLAGTGNKGLLLFALVAWPLLTAIPAFVVAAAAAGGLTVARQKGRL